MRGAAVVCFVCGWFAAFVFDCLVCGGVVCLVYNVLFFCDCLFLECLFGLLCVCLCLF